ncbi:hypothetical protein KDC22_07385 [Paenibacillus tritici]|uniref:hypothetical protein n=1 Tax=Paenibacillus tritici TaxID=1873425 RepID=UPI001BA4470A|nr:hypothetical protein [Paenibacillus tritici]QUL56320.1 hypothetical protein KDC22_07385 [Paenibacillus tritici]
MEQEVIFMNEYLYKDIKITFLDNLHVLGMYMGYYSFNNTIVIMPEEDHDDTRLLIPLSAVKTIEPWPID